MKKFYAKNLAYGAAALLVGAVGLTGCSSDDELTNVNPTYDGESVKTQFAINIPYGGGKGTRMTDVNTQQTGSFLGMQNIKLLPLTAEAADDKALVQIISLGNIENSGLTDQHKIYTDVNIPVGTTHFLFYGEALGTQPTSTTDAFAQGALKNTIAGAANTNSITFSLLPVTTNKGDVNSESKEAVLKAVKNVANAGDGAWKTYAEEVTNANKLLTNLYNEFTKKFPAGSAASVKLALTDLHNAIAELVKGSGTQENTLAQTINTAIENAIGADGNGGTLKDNKYPTDFNLPVGAAQLSWADGVPSWKDDASLGETNSVSLDITKVCYPASLSYFVSTGLKASNSSNPTWPTYSNWSGGTWGTEWNATSVSATTQSIALTSPIQYGVALLQTSVKCKTPTLEDNAKEMGGELQNRIITVPATTGFPVTGLLVGGQPNALKWNFKPSSDGDRTMTIYDKSVSGVTAGYNLSTTTNYTLVLENTKTSVTGTGDLSNADKVNVAIELTNNSGGDFYGADGVIKDGATFYLVGQLDMNRLGDGNNDAGRTSVFEQDYTTVATFTISSLKNAYNCIPDLRGTQLSLGLAVDLEWKNGVVFGVTID